jgi:hypothetical protein
LPGEGAGVGEGFGATAGEAAEVMEQEGLKEMGEGVEGRVVGIQWIGESGIVLEEGIGQCPGLGREGGVGEVRGQAKVVEMLEFEGEDGGGMGTEGGEVDEVGAKEVPRLRQWGVGFGGTFDQRHGVGGLLETPPIRPEVGIGFEESDFGQGMEVGSGGSSKAQVGFMKKVEFASEG